MREAAATVVNPVRGVNRLIYGDSWKPGPRYVDKEAMVPYHMEVGLGYRHINETGTPIRNSNNMVCMTFALIYNDPFKIEGNTPFEYFRAQILFNFSSRQSLLGIVKLCASIWNRNYDYPQGQELMWGIFQYYNYYNTDPLLSNSDDVPFRIAETVSYGTGFLARLPFNNNTGNLFITVTA